jgi:hypothetical protein
MIESRLVVQRWSAATYGLVGVLDVEVAAEQGGLLLAESGASGAHSLAGEDGHGEDACVVSTIELEEVTVEQRQDDGALMATEPLSLLCARPHRSSRKAAWAACQA